MHRILARLRRVVTVLITTALIVPTFYVQPASAVGDFTGGPMLDSAIYVPNDHTVMGLRWSAGATTDTTITTALAPNTTYYMKVRLSPVDGTGANNERAWTWNETSGQWVWVRDQNWPEFPGFTTDNLGRINGGHDVWNYFKFGSDDFTGAQAVTGGYRYYLFIALSTGKGGTLNSNNGPSPVSHFWPVTVFNMRTGGARIHNGAAVTSVFKRVETTAVNDTSTVIAVSQTETNTVDDDSNGVIDDEDYGPGGAPGDYLLGIPTGIPMDVLIQRRSFAVRNYTAVNADEDIAMGAVETTAPTAPTSLMAVPGDKKIDLTWVSSSDNVGVDHYNIYRSEIPTLASPTFTLPPALIATTTATAYEDHSVPVRTAGVTFKYEIRAADAATNVSAPSNAEQVVSQAVLPMATVSAPGIVSATSTSKDFPVSWSGTSPSGTLVFDVDYRMNSSLAGPGLPAGWTPWKVGTSATTAKFVSTIGNTYEFRVTARDEYGNASAPAVSGPAVVPYDHVSFRYSSGWSTFSSNQYYRGSVRYTSTNGASGAITFSGGAWAYLVATKAPTRARAKVYIDGKYVRTINLYSAKVAFRQSIYLGSLSGTGNHTVKLVNLWTSGRKTLDIDGVAVKR